MKENKANFTLQIGKISYEISVKSSEFAKMEIEEKMKKIIENEALSDSFAVDEKLSA